MSSSGWYSNKFNKAGLFYELGIAIFHHELVWINGPFPAGQNDKQIFTKPGSLKSKMLPRKRTIGDEVYVGHPDQIPTRNGLDSGEVKMYKKRVKACLEIISERADLKAAGRRRTDWPY